MSATAGVPPSYDPVTLVHWLWWKLRCHEGSAEDFQKLYENPDANGMQLFFAGKLKVKGNQMLAMKLKDLFALR